VRWHAGRLQIRLQGIVNGPADGGVEAADRQLGRNASIDTSPP
jgi:hypothetical protein